MKLLVKITSLRILIVTILTLAGFILTNAQTGIYVPSMQSSDDLITSFLTNYDIQGATVAIAKDGKLVYMRAFGNADISGQELTQPYHIFRIASLSKPITGAAIVKLWEEGLLDFDAKVFGSGGLLNGDPYYSGANITDNRIYDITVRNLLEHTAGWNRDIPMTPNPLPPYPWGYPSSDPIGFPLHVTLTLGEPNPVTERALVKFLLERGLDVDPGTEYHYSNIGYVILGEIIESITGMEYENYVKQEIFNPIGAYDMHIGKNLLGDKMEREGEYINTFTTLSCYGTGQYVPWQYGGWNLEAMDAHGGWIASARDLLRFVLAADGFNTRPDFLQPASIDTMTKPSAMNQNYAKGWQVNQYNNWWHTGSLDGTRSILVRSNNGFAWVAILNDGGSGNFWSDFDNLIWNCLASTSSYPSHDLFDSPLQNSAQLTLTNTSETSVDVSWIHGDGSGRILIVKADNPTSKFPLDGEDYTASSTFGAGDDLGDGNYVVYSGSESNVSVTGLSSNTNYHFRLFEYNNSTITGNNTLYLLANSEMDSINTSATSVDDETLPQEFALDQNYPNPFNPSTTIRFSIPQSSFITLEVFNALGEKIDVLVSEELNAGTYNYDLNASNLTSGIYLYRLQATDFVETKKMILMK
jgi:CubicO group peptidase (beta-lactamase class C family)